MSSCNSWSETFSAVRSSVAFRRRPARPASIRMLASVTSRANRSGRIPELPIDRARVRPRVEARRPLEVVLGLGRVADLASDPAETEDADRLALVRVADDVELTALVEQLVSIDPAGLGLAPFDR